MVIILIDLNGRNVLCETKEEVDEILKEAEKQCFRWSHSDKLATKFNPFEKNFIVLKYFNYVFSTFAYPNLSNK